MTETSFNMSAPTLKRRWTESPQNELILLPTSAFPTTPPTNNLLPAIADLLPDPLIRPQYLETSEDRFLDAQPMDFEASGDRPPDTQPAGDDEDELNVSSDSDLDDGDEVIARRYPRNHLHLEQHGFRPVWTPWEGYPGEIPADIREYLDEDGTCGSAKMIGPLRSLAWLAGLDELVEAIDHPAYAIRDEIEVVPFGAEITFPINRHWDEGNIPPRIWDKVTGDSWSRTTWTSGATVRPQIPPGVNETPTAHNLRSLYACARVQTPTGTVQFMKVKYNRSLPQLERTIRRQAGQSLASRNLWFRGTSIQALAYILYFFIPEIRRTNFDNEFGPGFYTTDSFKYALRYLSGGGVILVFKDPDVHSTRLWQPSPQDWNAWVARWLHLPLAITEGPAPSQSLTAEFIQGAISGERPRGGGLPLPGRHQQLVAVSYKGCEVLSRSLEMIIFVERR
ncbi:hypothetical protein PENDEC_c001G01312 [Penicillium decumbens]|uniref:Uncharacterized protein n=1 Tax=Penicillium decumbens TaxID=69771 RepID=A0A1V6PN87_PENDC|nr:hypothetical protein PENDEC_c001G01312 [Penicillium decumbens]